MSPLLDTLNTERSLNSTVNGHTEPDHGEKREEVPSSTHDNEEVGFSAHFPSSENLDTKEEDYYQPFFTEQFRCFISKVQALSQSQLLALLKHSTPPQEIMQDPVLVLESGNS